MASHRSKFNDKIEDLNLVPIMNLVVCLIPIVLFGTALVKVGIVNVNAPRFGMGQAEAVEDDKKPLNLTLAIGEDGIRITASGADINEVLGLAPAAAPADEAAAPAAGPLIPKKGDQYDYMELYNKLSAIKNRYPEETIVNLTADARIPFKVLIATMDVLRVRLEQDTYEDFGAFQTASMKYDQGAPQLLWPDVVFAVAQ